MAGKNSELYWFLYQSQTDFLAEDEFQCKLQTPQLVFFNFIIAINCNKVR